MVALSHPLQERVSITVRPSEVVLSCGSVARTPPAFPMDRRALSHASYSLQPYLHEFQRSLVDNGYLALEAAAASKLVIYLFKPATRTSRGGVRAPHHMSVPADLYHLARQPQMYGWDHPDLHATLEDIALHEPVVLDTLRLLQCVLYQHLDIVMTSTPRDARNPVQRTLPEPAWLATQRGVLCQTLGEGRYRVLQESSQVQEHRIIREIKKRARCGGVCESECGNALCECCTRSCGFMAAIFCICHGC